MENQWDYMTNEIANFIPALLGALLVLLIGWLIAKGIRALIIKLLKRTNWDERIFGKSNMGDTNIFLANIVYYILMIIVLLIVLEILGVDQVLRPLEDMVGEFLAFIPNLIGAILIAFIGYLLAKFVSNLVNIGGSVLDRFVDKTGFKDTNKLISILRKVVFIVIFVPFLIQAFNALQLDAISDPANEILYGFTEMIGQILVAAAILLVFIWGGRYLATFMEDLFRSLGLDRTSEKIQIHNMIGANQSLSKIVANLLYFFLVFFGIITAVEILGLDRLTEILNEVLDVTGQIIFGLIILAIGNYISLLIYNTMTRSNNNRFIAGVIRWASLALFIAISLRTMGIANEIVELAFGLILGAIAVAVALSYGLGGRDAAGEHFKDIIKKFREESSNMTFSEPPNNLPGNSGNRPQGPENSEWPENPTGDNMSNRPANEPQSPGIPGRGSQNPNRATEVPHTPNRPANEPQSPGIPGSGSQNPNRATEGPQTPNRPNQGPDNPNRPDTPGSQNPTRPNQGPENPNRSGENQNPSRPDGGPINPNRPGGSQNPDGPGRGPENPNKS